MKITIVGGSGRLGSWYAKRLAAAGHAVTITGRNLEKLRGIAADSGLVATTDSVAAMRDASVIIISTPIATTAPVIELACREAPKGALVCDFASVKKTILGAYRVTTRDDLELASLHPLHGPRVSCLQGLTVLTVPLRTGPNYLQLCHFLSSSGARLVTLDEAQHDKDMAVLQGLTHFVAITAACTLVETSVPAFETPAYALLRTALARVLLQDPALYAAIQLENHENQAMRKAFLRKVEDLARLAESGDLAALQREIEKGGRAFGDPEQELGDTDACLAVLTSRRQDPKTHRIATLGPPGTFSDFAVRKLGQLRDWHVTPVYHRTITEVFDAVKKGEVPVGVVPVENMIDGTIAITLDTLFATGLKVSAELLVPVHHAIAANPGTRLADIKRVLSIPPVLAQIGTWLRAHAPTAKLVETNSTAEAITQVAQTRLMGDAAVGLATTAEATGLTVLARDIEDERGNETRFFLIGTDDAERTGHDRTSLCVHDVSNKPGVLDHILHVMAAHGLNLSKVESRPTRKRLGDYQFYIDVEGHRDDEPLQKAIAILRREAEVTILGSYPRTF